MLLSSCSKEQRAKEDFISFPFEKEMRVEYEGIEYVLDATIRSENDITLAFKSPARLKDFKISLSDGKTRLTYHDIELELDGEYAANNGILLISKVLLYDKSSLDSAKIVKLAGVKYCRQRYTTATDTVDIYFADGSDSPSFIEAQINGRALRIVFVNE
jgi:hypothetical protein